MLESCAGEETADIIESVLRICLTKKTARADSADCSASLLRAALHGEGDWSHLLQQSDSQQPSAALVWFRDVDWTVKYNGSWLQMSQRLETAIANEAAVPAGLNQSAPRSVTVSSPQIQEVVSQDHNSAAAAESKAA